MLQKHCPQAGVYRIVNIIDGKVYIGGTKNLYRRKYQHSGMLKRGVHHSPRLQFAYDQYGKGAFRFEVIQTVPILSDTHLIEQKYIDLHKSYDPEFGYNISPNSETTKGVPCSEGKKVLISQANTGKIRSESFKRRISKLTTLRNLTASPETRRKWSAYQKRVMNTPERMEMTRRVGLMNRRISDGDIESMIEMKKNGVCNTEIGKKFGTADTYVCDLIRKYLKRKMEACVTC